MKNVLRVLLVLLLAVVVSDVSSAAAQTRPVVTIIAFNKGLAWRELFGPGDVKTDRLKEFENRENIEVRIEWGDERHVRQKVAVDLASRAGLYDILLVGSDGAVQTYAYGGVLEELDSYLQKKRTPDFNPDDILSSFLDANRVEGKLYALPYYSFGPVLTYRKSYFQKYGVTPPRTTDELVTVLTKIKEGLARDGIRDVYPLTMRGAPGEEPSLDLLGFVWAFGGTWFEQGASTPAEIRRLKAKPTFDTTFAPGFKFFTDLLRNFGPPGAANHTWLDQGNLLAQGKAVVGMPQGSAFSFGKIRSKDPAVAEDLAAATIPTGPTGRRIMSFWTFSMGISKHSKNKDAAWKVLNLLVGREAMESYAALVQRPMVTLRPVLFSKTLVDRYGRPTLEIIEDGVLKGTPHYFPYIPEADDFFDRIGTAASNVIAGKLTAEQALKELQDWATATMTKAGYYR